jgi:hypothetical protein
MVNYIRGATNKHTRLWNGSTKLLLAFSGVISFHTPQVVCFFLQLLRPCPTNSPHQHHGTGKESLKVLVARISRGSETRLVGVPSLGSSIQERGLQVLKHSKGFEEVESVVHW